MDFLRAEYPLKLIRDKFNLTDAQLMAALSYIEANRIQVGAEYQEVLQTREEIRQYWEAHNRERLVYLGTKPHELGKEAFWEKLSQQKVERALTESTA